ncbi:MAG TPA: hypothetical protein VG323_15295, partial [Thermoanaerobaculia bacterium]|nr:hypothetical protein [Thermoanaerobaculia bacterium]
MMLRPVPMAHFRAQVPNRDAAAATRAIAAEGMLHLVDVAHGRAPYDAAPPGVRELYASFRDLFQRLRATADRVGVVPADLNGGIADEAVSDFTVERDRIAVELEPIEKRVQALARERGAAHDRVAGAREALGNNERIARAALDVARLQQLRFTALRLAIAPAETLPSISASLSPVSHVVVPLEETADGVFFAAAVTATASARLDEALQLAAAQPVVLDAKDSDVATAERAEADAQRAIDDERTKSAEPLRDLLRRAEVATLLLQAQTYFAAAGRFVVISGWVPEAGAERLRRRVVAATDGRAIVEIE